MKEEKAAKIKSIRVERNRIKNETAFDAYTNREIDKARKALAALNKSIVEKVIKPKLEKVIKPKLEKVVKPKVDKVLKPTVDIVNKVKVVKVIKK